MFRARFRFSSHALSQITGFTLLSLMMAFAYSRLLPENLDLKTSLHSVSVGVLIVFSFLAGYRKG